jgi:aspartate racemase
MEQLVTPGITLVKANRVADAYAPLAEAAHRLRARGAAAVVLGCTEIPLGIAAGPPLGLPVVDTVAALARAAIRHVRGVSGLNRSNGSVRAVQSAGLAP